MKNKKNILYWITGLAIFGTLVSLYSLLHKQGFASGEFCSLNDTFNCDVVNQGPYSEIIGIPVALLGVLGYGFMAIAAWMKSRSIDDRSLTLFLVLASLGALGFSLYLSSIEAFILEAWCILCMTSQIAILGVAVLVAAVFRSERKK